MCNLKYDKNEPIYETETDLETQRVRVCVVAEGEGGKSGKD